MNKISSDRRTHTSAAFIVLGARSDAKSALPAYDTATLKPRPAAQGITPPGAHRTTGCICALT